MALCKVEQFKTTTYWPVNQERAKDSYYYLGMIRRSVCNKNKETMEVRHRLRNYYRARLETSKPYPEAWKSYLLSHDETSYTETLVFKDMSREMAIRLFDRYLGMEGEHGDYAFSPSGCQFSYDANVISNSETIHIISKSFDYDV